MKNAKNTKKQVDIGVIKNLLSDHNIKEAIEYSQNHGISQIELAKLAQDLTAKLNQTQFWIIVGIDHRGNKGIYKKNSLYSYFEIKTQQDAFDYGYLSERSAKQALVRMDAGNTNKRFQTTYSIESITIKIEPFNLTQIPK